jgi:hypothetical protein
MIFTKLAILPLFKSKRREKNARYRRRKAKAVVFERKKEFSLEDRYLSL